MKSKVIATVIAVLFTGSLCFSQPDSRDNKEPKQKEAVNKPPVPPMHLPGLPPPLDLPGMTPEQHDKLKAVDIKHLEIITPLRNQIAEKQTKLVSLLTAKTVDNAQTNSIADEISKLKADILKQDISHDQAMRQLFTPDQKVIFDAIPKPFLLP